MQRLTMTIVNEIETEIIDNKCHELAQQYVQVKVNRTTTVTRVEVFKRIYGKRALSMILTTTVTFKFQNCAQNPDY